jgi:hypothetical protein
LTSNDHPGRLQDPSWQYVLRVLRPGRNLEGVTDTQHGVPLAENKTRPTDASVDDYLASRASEHQRGDCQALMALLQEVTRESPRMWGPSIVGYGVYRYTYESGRTGEAPAAAFAIRGRDLVLYITAESDAQRSRLSKLGRHKMGKSCLYFRRLADLDKDVLEQLITGSVAEVRRRYG